MPIRGASIARRLVIGIGILLALAVPRPALAQDVPRAGGVLKAAMIGEPPTLDTHTTTATIAYQVRWHMFESLYTYDKNYAPIPMLAEAHVVSDGGRRHTITLRKGVRFHNGKELTAADAAASLTRWGRLHTTGKTMWKVIEAVEAKDQYTLVIHLKEPSGSLLYALASPYLAIYPKSMPTRPRPAHQGVHRHRPLPVRRAQTRPSHPARPLQGVRGAHGAAPTGSAASAPAYVDEISLRARARRGAVRLAGVESGEYHFGQTIKPDQYDRLKGDPKLDLARREAERVDHRRAEPQAGRDDRTRRSARPCRRCSTWSRSWRRPWATRRSSASTARSTSPSRASSTRRPASPGTT